MIEEPKVAPRRPEVTVGEIATNEMPVHFVKSNFHRVVHVDGIWGGGTPTPGNIMMSLFSHRAAFPEKIVNDAFGREIPEKRIVKAGLENELEVSVVMDLKTAKIMRQWLDSTITNVEATLAQTKQK